MKSQPERYASAVLATLVRRIGTTKPRHGAVLAASSRLLQSIGVNFRPACRCRYSHLKSGFDRGDQSSAFTIRAQALGDDNPEQLVRCSMRCLHNYRFLLGRGLTGAFGHRRLQDYLVEMHG